MSGLAWSFGWFAQLRLWMLDQLQPGTSLYNIPTMLRASGDLDEAALAAALTGLVARHEALRTTFVAVGGTPVQVIGAAQPLPRQDLPDATWVAAVQAHFAAETAQPFDLARGPLLRAAAAPHGERARPAADAASYCVRQLVGGCAAARPGVRDESARAEH